MPSMWLLIQRFPRFPKMWLFSGWAVVSIGTPTSSIASYIHPWSRWSSALVVVQECTLSGWTTCLNYIRWTLSVMPFPIRILLLMAPSALQTVPIWRKCSLETVVSGISNPFRFPTFLDWNCSGWTTFPSSTPPPFLWEVGFSRHSSVDLPELISLVIHEGAFRDCRSVLFESVHNGLLSSPDIIKLHTLSFDWYTFHGYSKEEWSLDPEEETLEAKLETISNSVLTIRSYFLSILSLPDLPSLKKFKAYGHNFQLFRTIQINGIQTLINDN